MIPLERFDQVFKSLKKLITASAGNDWNVEVSNLIAADSPLIFTVYIPPSADRESIRKTLGLGKEVDTGKNSAYYEYSRYIEVCLDWDSLDPPSHPEVY